MSKMGKCVLCEQCRDEILVENDEAFVIHAGDPIMPGHLIAATKGHVETLSQMTPGQAGGLFALVAEAARRAVPVTGAEKYYIVSIADMVRHYHIHILPKMPGKEPLGPFIMSPEGWRGNVAEYVSRDNIANFLAEFKQSST